MNNATISVIGLCFDIIGVILLWKFGLPPEVSRSGASYLQVQSDDESEKTKGRLYDCIAHAAILLIVLGFALQAVGTLLPANAFGRSQEIQKE
ncbi:MAG: hypothetical protein ABL933_17130 [Methyloglobulus sp.]